MPLPPLPLIQLAKSLKAICSVLNVVLKKSTVFWLLSNNSLRILIASNKSPIPAALIATPKPLNPVAKPLIPFLESLALSPMSFVLSAISLIAFEVLSACFCEAFNASMSSSNFFSSPERSAPITMFFSIAICLMLL